MCSDETESFVESKVGREGRAWCLGDPDWNLGLALQQGASRVLDAIALWFQPFQIVPLNVQEPKNGRGFSPIELGATGAIA